jgi:hypothetical protein
MEWAMFGKIFSGGRAAIGLYNDLLGPARSGIKIPHRGQNDAAAPIFLAGTSQ